MKPRRMVSIRKDRMKLGIFIVGLAFISMSAEAEMIDGPANVRDKLDGRVLFALADNAGIECRKIENDWFDIALPVYVDAKESFADDAKTILNKDVKLYDEHGKNIGITLDGLETEPFYDEDITNGRKIVVLKGFTHRRNIRRDSILELNLGAALDKSNAFALTDFSGHLNAFHYNAWMPRDKFNPYIYFDNPTTSEAPWPRAVMFFYENRLVAVYHDKPIPSDRITPSVKIRGSTMSYVMGVTPEIRKKLAAIYYPMIEVAD